MRKILVLILSILTALSVRPFAEAAEAKRAAAKTATLEGRVIDQTTEKSVPGIDVIAGGISPPVSVSTGADGSFTLQDVPAGEVRLFAYAPGFELSETILVKVRAGQRLTGITLKILSKAAAEKERKDLAKISGRVRAGAQSPPEPVAVFLLDSERKVVDGRKTEPDGSFHFEAEAGAYVVSIDPTGLEGFDLKETEVSVPALKPGQPAAGIEFVFEPVARIYGFVRDHEGKPISWVTVKAWRGKDSEPLFDATDASGAYALEGLTAGEWNFEVRRDDRPILYEFLKIDPLKEKEREISMKDAPFNGEIIGRVQSKAGKPLSGISVFATWEIPEQIVIGPVKTDSQGRFHFKGLAIFTYTVSAVGPYGTAAEKSCPAGENPEKILTVVLTVAETEEEALRDDPNHQKITAAFEKWERTSRDPEALKKLAGPIEKELPAGAVVEGTVLNAAGAPAAEAVVFLMDERKNPIPDSVVAADSKGKFQIMGVPDGSYHIQAGKGAEQKTEPEPVSVSKGRVEKPIQLRLP